MKISIITVAFNAAETITATLRSVAVQTYAKVEHIVIDGASCDDTAEVVAREGGHVTKFISEPDRGIYDAMNKGLRHATGDIVGFLNADDVYAKEQVLTRVAAAFSDPAIAACYADLVYVDPDNLDKVVRYWQSCPYEDGLFGKGWSPPHPTFFVRKSIYETYGCFDLSYLIGNDVELMMRFLARYKIASVYLPDVLVKMRTGGVSNRSISNIFKQNIEILKAAKRNNVPVSPFVFIFSKIFSRVHQLRVRPKSVGY